MPFILQPERSPQGDFKFLYSEKLHGLSGQRFHIRVSPGMAEALAISIDAILLGATQGEPRKPSIETRLRFEKLRNYHDWRVFHSAPVTTDCREIFWIESEYPVEQQDHALVTFIDKHYGEVEGGRVQWAELQELAKQLRNLPAGA